MRGKRPALIVGAIFGLAACARSALPIPAGSYALGTPSATDHFERRVAPAELRGSAIGRVSSSERIDLYVQLPGRNDNRLAALVAGIIDRSSPLYEHYLTPDQFGRAFGANPDVYRKAITFLRSGGFIIDDLPENRTDIVVHASAAVVEAAFHTPFDLLRDGDRVYYTNRYEPLVPNLLRGAAISGLDSYVVHHPMLHRAPAIIVNGAFSWGPQDVAAAYDLNPLYQAHLDGKGMIIANATCGAARADDLALFQKRFSLPAAPLITTAMPEGSELRATCAQGRYNFGNSESSLDADWATAVAREVTFQQVVAHGPATNDFDVAYSYIVNHRGDKVRVVMTSWGSCEREMQKYASASLRIDERLFAQAAAEGQHWFASSGDNGSDDCQDGGNAVSVDYPGSSAYVTDVGGTTVEGKILHGNVKGWKGETAWSSADSPGATGGGKSILYDKPAYQEHGTPRDGARDVPDVALVADPTNDGLWIVNGGQLQGGWGGTSEAAPQWAALFAIIEQRYNGMKIADPHSRLYQLASSTQYHKLFHDIVKGSNGVTDMFGVFSGYHAGPGFDQTTGWGSYIGSELVKAY